MEMSFTVTDSGVQKQNFVALNFILSQTSILSDTAYLVTFKKLHFCCSSVISSLKLLFFSVQAIFREGDKNTEHALSKFVAMTFPCSGLEHFAGGAFIFLN